MQLRFMMMGRSYDASAQLPESVELTDGATIEEALEAIDKLLPAGQTLPASCLVVLTGRHLGTVARHEATTVSALDELVLIAPVAGG
jgi:hypothetical protein